MALSTIEQSTSPVVSSGLVDYLNNPTTYDGTVLSTCESQECGN